MFFITAATILAALFQVILAQDLRINTLPSVVQCQPVQFTWTGGAPPYYFELIPGGQPGAAAIKQFPTQTGNSMTWMVNLPAGTTFTSSLKDSTGLQAYSDQQTVQAGPDSSCINDSTTAVTSTGSSTASTNPSVASINSATTSTMTGNASQKGSSTTTTTSASGSGSGIAAKVSSSSTASSTSAAPTSSNAASLHASAGAIGIAGLLGLAGAALLG